MRILTLWALVASANALQWEKVDGDFQRNTSTIVHELTLALKPEPGGLSNLTRALEQAADPASALYGKWLSDEARLR